MRSPNILVADDDPETRELIRLILKDAGMKVVLGENGSQLLELWRANPIDLIILDVMMPVMDGQTSIQAIRKINPQIRIIAASGLAEKDKLETIANIQVQAFLPKPYTAERLLRTIHEVSNTKKKNF